LCDENVILGSIMRNTEVNITASTVVETVAYRDDNNASLTRGQGRGLGQSQNNFSMLRPMPQH